MTTGAPLAWADRWYRWFQALPRPVVALDLDGRVLGFNISALDLFEIPGESLERADFAAEALHESSRGGFAEIARHRGDILGRPVAGAGGQAERGPQLGRVEHGQPAGGAAADVVHPAAGADPPRGLVDHDGKRG